MMARSRLRSVLYSAATVLVALVVLEIGASWLMLVYYRATHQQNFETYDGNVRLTLRPWRNVTLLSRYEFQSSTIHTKPDSISGLGEVESSEMTSHILAQSISWSRDRRIVSFLFRLGWRNEILKKLRLFGD